MNPPVRPNFEAGEEIVDAVHGWYEGDYCAITTWEGWVRLFSLSRQKVVTEFFTRKGPCGVNVAMSGDGKRCFVSPGYSWGVGCFAVETGEFIWRWKGPGYRLSFCSASNSLYAYAGVGKALRFDPETGSLLEEFRGMRGIFPSPLANGVVTVHGKSISVRDVRMKEMFSFPKESFAVLDVAWSESAVAVSEARNRKPDGTSSGVRCFDLRTGALLWRHVERRNHVKPLMYRPARRTFVGVDFKGSPDDALLLQWDELSGRVIHEETIPDDWRGRLCGRAELMLVVERKTHAATVLQIE